MPTRTNSAEIDDRPELRESPVRHAHAVLASRHGRASSPGYLGLPVEEDQGEGADPDLTVLFADVGELGEVVDVDQVLGLRQPQLHHRQEAVAARDDAGLGPEPVERGDGALDARRALVLEWRRSLQTRSLSAGR